MKINRKLSGIYFRAKRDDKFENICFEDLTAKEQSEIMLKNSNEWLMSLTQQLANTINDLGEHFNIAKD